MCFPGSVSGLCWAKTARNAARFSFWFFWSVFGAVDWLFRKSSICLRGADQE